MRVCLDDCAAEALPCVDGTVVVHSRAVTHSGRPCVDTECLRHAPAGQYMQGGDPCCVVAWIAKWWTVCLQSWDKRDCALFSLFHFVCHQNFEEAMRMSRGDDAGVLQRSGMTLTRGKKRGR